MDPCALTNVASLRVSFAMGEGLWETLGMANGEGFEGCPKS